MNSHGPVRSASRGLALLAIVLALAVSAVAQTPAEPIARLHWKAMWIAHPTAPLRELAVFHFRKLIRLDSKPQRFVVHVSADSRFILFVNGVRIGEGPARADLAHWRYETFDLAPVLRAGDNAIAAVVWQYGVYTPLTQFTDRAAFLMEGDTETESAVNTDASWQVELEPGHSFIPRVVNSFWTGLYAAPIGERIDAATYNWDWKTAGTTPNSHWVAAASALRESIYPSAAVASSREVGFEGIWALVPDPLPPMEYSPVGAGKVVRADLPAATDFPRSPVVVPARMHTRIMLDRETMVTGYPELIVSGGKGSKITARYAEALYDAGQERHDRNQVGSLQMLSPLQEEFLPDGAENRSFMPLAWRTWRYLELEIATAEEPLRLEGMHVFFSAYPFVERAHFQSTDPELAKIWEFCWRGARLGARENYMDTPFWEQLQYIGDTRIQALISYVVSGDDRLARQALRAFDASRRPDGLTQSRYPSNLPQYIPSFSLLFVNMLHDYWMYRPDAAFVAEILPGTRATLQWFLRRQRADGFLGKLPYWGMVDMPENVKDWKPMDAQGRSAIQTLLFVGALLDAAEMEEAIGDRSLAVLYRRQARLASDAVYRSCWNGSLGLLADTPEQKTYSQHANLYAVLVDAIPPRDQAAVMRKVLAPDGPGYKAEGAVQLAHVSYFFTFYLNRAMQHAHRADDYLQVLKPWREMLAKGLTTAPEYPDPTRSDTHAWSAHPAYDLLTIVAGITPAAPGFTRIAIAPSLGDLKEVQASIPHPQGTIEVHYKLKTAGLEATITLPKGLQGTFTWHGREYRLHEGAQTLLAQ